MEQDIRIQLETYPENFEQCKCSLILLFSSTPQTIQIDFDNVYEINSMMDLYDIIFSNNIVEHLINEIEFFLKEINTGC